VLALNGDHIAEHVIDSVDECDVLSDDHVFVIPRSWRQLASEVARHTVGAALQLSVVRLAGLHALLLCGCEPILRSHSSRRVVLVLVVPVLRDLLVMLVEPLVLSILARRSRGEEK
jgi:hypothetical protein